MLLPLLFPITAQNSCWNRTGRQLVPKNMTIPELLLTDAHLPLADPALPPPNAVAVAHGRILAVGRRDDLENLAGPATRRRSLQGASLLPGFHDAHCHILGFGQTLSLVSLAGTNSIPEILARLEARADAEGAGEGNWLRGRGYNQNGLAERRHPTRQDLDTLGGGQPFVLITHASGHAVAVNSRVLQAAGITRETPDPPGGTIVRDERGEPTGVLLETAAPLAYALAPELSRIEKIAALRRATTALNALGITSAVDATMGVAAGDSFADIGVYRQAEDDGSLRVRCTLMMGLRQLAGLTPMIAPRDLGQETDFVRIGPAKVFTDGALTTRTALLRASFADDSHNLGTAVWTAYELSVLTEKAHRASWQIAAHAIGDAAIDLCLDAYGKAQARHPRPDARHRIEHAMLLWPDQIGRMARLGVLPVYQPEFIARFGDAYHAALGKARADRLMPYAETQAAGLPLVFSSDLPVVPGSPLDGLAATCRRQTPAGLILGPPQRVSPADALRAYTEGAAYSVFAEADRGRIAPGHRADFVVLNGDPLTLPPEEWEDGLHVQATLVGGNVVFGEL